MITVLAGGVGAARFLRGLIDVVDPADVTAVVNTGDDSTINGLRISPDLDTVTYTVAGAIDSERGWGLGNESWRVMESLGRYANVRPVDSVAANTWFNLGDRDLATHLYRTARLQEGASLTEVTDEITRAWNLAIRLLPMSDDPVATMIEIVEETTTRVVPFQDYFVGMRHSVPVRSVRFAGIESARPNFLPLIEASEAIVIAPSNPLVSIGPVRALPGVDERLAAHRSKVVAVSPIIAGAAIKGPADRMLTELGMEASVVGVARLYSAICGSLVIDHRDAHLATAVESEGVRCIVTDTIMSNPQVSAELARVTLSAVIEKGR